MRDTWFALPGSHSLGALASFALGACLAGCAQTTEAPVDPPDYAAAFPSDEVGALHLTITAADWQAMLADMTELGGEFGVGMGGGMMMGGGTLPPELTTACNGLAAGDACSLTLGGMAISGTCTLQTGALMCIPAGGMMGGMMGGGMMGPGGDILSRNPVYVECEVDAEGQHWEHVGIRFKGNSSLSSTWSEGSYKLPLRLDFDHFDDAHPETDHQRFFGFENLSLSNGWSDDSLIRDKVGTDIFRDFGLPAPATAFYRVYIDHGEGEQYFGLYTLIEVPSDDSFMDTQFGGHAGNLYKPEGTGATWATFDTATLGKENHTAAADFSDAEALYTALHADRTDAAAWRTGLEARLDVDGFLRWLALNTVIEDWDTYGNMSHNYFLYADPSDGGRFHWIPWDHTFAFSNTLASGGVGGGGVGGGMALPIGLETTTEAWPLIRFLLDDSVYTARYRELVREASRFYSDRAPTYFRTAHDLIAAAVAEETAEHTLLSSPAAFDAAHTTLLTFPAARAAAVSTYLGEAP